MFVTRFDDEKTTTYQVVAALVAPALQHFDGDEGYAPFVFSYRTRSCPRRNLLWLSARCIDSTLPRRQIRSQRLPIVHLACQRIRVRGIAGVGVGRAGSPPFDQSLLGTHNGPDVHFVCHCQRPARRRVATLTTHSWLRHGTSCAYNSFIFMLLRSIWLVAVMSVTATVSVWSQGCYSTLSGQVFDDTSGEPIAFATVSVKEARQAMATDAEGRYAINNLCLHTTYTVEVHHVGCDHAMRVLEINGPTRIDFRLTPSALLQEVVVAGQAVEARTSQAVVSVEGTDLESKKAQNLAETLRELPGVTVLNTGSSIGKPVIQGLHSNRIAIVANGTTIESQQWGAEHAPEVDPFIADRITVVKGAAGVRYGAGAMGGAIVVESAPLRTQDGWGGWLTTGGSSNGRSGVLAGSLDYKRPQSTLAMRLQGTLKRSGNLHTPDYFLANTGTAEAHVAAAAGWRKGKWRHEVEGYRFEQQLGVMRASHTGSTTELDSAIRSDRPLNNDDRFTYQIKRPMQRVEHNLLKIKSLYRLSDTWRWSLQAATQYNRRREYDAYKPTGAIEQGEPRPQVTFNIVTGTLDASVEHYAIKNWTGAAGVQAITQYNYVSRGGLIPDYLSAGGSVWFTERWRRPNKPLELELGARYDYRWSHVTDTVGSLRYLNERLQWANPSASLGAIWHFNAQWTTTLHTGLAWRPPHVYELFARGVHHGSGTFEQGNAALRPESAWNTNLTLDYNSQRAAAQVVVYRNQIANFIYLNPDLQRVLTVRGSFPSYSYRQSDAVLQGLDGSFTFLVRQHLWIEGRASLLRAARTAVDTSAGRERAYRDWLPLMPADRFGYGFRWTIRPAREERGASYLKIMATTTLLQTRLPDEGLVKPAPATATVVSLDGGHTVRVGKHAIDLGVTIRNLTNQRYREYLNFFRLYADEPGFNCAVRAKITF
jgi:iron complex outermembrane recepter protein